MKKRRRCYDEDSWRNNGYWPVIGSIAVLVLSPLLEIVTGSELAYLLVLPALIALLWPLTGLWKHHMGLYRGDRRWYGAALFYPVAVMSVAVGIVLMAGGAHLEGADWGKAARNFFLVLVSTCIGTIITEEGFFRGWLWGAIQRRGREVWTVLIWTSAVFALWHLPVALMEEDFKLPATVIPVYIANAFLLGLCWGILRRASISIFVAAFSHGVWNAFAYVLFGYGTKTGVLGVDAYTVYGPERGIVGIALNAAAVALLWRWQKSRVPF